MAEGRACPAARPNNCPPAASRCCKSPVLHGAALDGPKTQNMRHVAHTLVDLRAPEKARVVAGGTRMRTHGGRIRAH